MIILRCNKCEKEAMWSLNLAGRLPDDWLAFEGRDLCPDCAKKFIELKSISVKPQAP